MPIRLPIYSEDLSDEQQEMLRSLHETDIHEAFDAVLSERGLPLTVSRFELAGPVSEEEPIGPDGFPKTEHPPPGGCYCCQQDRDGNWICYCC